MSHSTLSNEFQLQLRTSLISAHIRAYESLGVRRIYTDCTLLDHSCSLYALRGWRLSVRCNGDLNSHEPLFTETPRHFGILFFSRYFTLRSALFTLLQLRHGERLLLGPAWTETDYNA